MLSDGDTETVHAREDGGVRLNDGHWNPGEGWFDKTWEQGMRCLTDQTDDVHLTLLRPVFCPDSQFAKILSTCFVPFPCSVEDRNERSYVASAVEGNLELGKQMKLFGLEKFVKVVLRIAAHWESEALKRRHFTNAA